MKNSYMWLFHVPLVYGGHEIIISSILLDWLNNKNVRYYAHACMHDSTRPQIEKKKKEKKEERSMLSRALSL